MPFLSGRGLRPRSGVGQAQQGNPEGDQRESGEDDLLHGPNFALVAAPDQGAFDSLDRQRAVQ